MKSRSLCLLALVTLALADATWTAPPALAQDQEDPQATVLYRRATTFYKQSEWQFAEDAFKELIDKFPKSSYVPEARYFMGVCQVRQIKHAEAIKTFQDFIKLHADSKRLEGAYTFLAQSQLALGQKDLKRQKELLTAAIATFGEQLKKWPTSAQAANAYFSRGDAYFALGNKDEALKDFSAVVEKFGEKSDKFAEAIYSVGYVLQEQQKWEAAAKSFADFLTRFSDQKPKHALLDEVRMRYGETLLAREQFTEAEKWLQLVAEAEGFKFADHATRRWAESNAFRKKYAEAAKLYLSIPEKFPKLDNVDPTFCRLEGARNAYLAQQFDVCRAALAKVIPLGGEAGAEAAHWTARSWLSEKKPAEALQTVEPALSKASGTKWEPELMLDRGDALLEIPAKLKEAPAAFYAAYAKFPTHARASQALYNAAFAAMSAADYPAATKHVQEFRAKFKNDPLLADAIFVEAESHVQLGGYDKAAPLYGELLTAQPKHRDAELWKVRLGQCFFLQKKYDGTIENLRPHLDGLKNPTYRAEAHYLVGHSQFELRQYAEAAKSLQAALAADAQWPQADDAMVTLGRSLRALKDVKGAAGQFRAVLEKFPKSNVTIDAHYHLGDCLRDLGDAKGAAKEYQWVIDNAKGTDFVPYALNALGWVLVEDGDAAGSQRTFQRLIDELPKHVLFARAHVGRGAASQKLMQFDKAEADFRKYLSVAPNAPDGFDVRHELGKCQAAQKKFAEAAGTFSAILTENPKYQNAVAVAFDLAWALKDQGKDADAVKRFEEVYARSPDSVLGLESQTQVGEHYLNKKDYEKSAKLYFDVAEQAEKLRTAGTIPADRANALRELALYNHGLSQFHLKQYDKSEKTFAQLVVAYPKGPLAADSLYMLGESQLKGGRAEGASETFAKYTASYPQGRFLEQATLGGAQAANQLGYALLNSDGDPAKLARAKKLFEQGLALAKKFAADYPKSEQLPEGIYEQGWSLKNLDRLDEALPQFEAVTAKTDREVAAKARFMVAEIHFQKKDYAKAVQNYYDVAYGFGYPAWQVRALFEAARCFEQLKKTDQAKERYKEIIAKFPQSEEAKNAKKRLESLQQ
jgi:TolA-binding protein